MRLELGQGMGILSPVPRANRYLVPGLCYHLTHRCHNQAFLLKFARDRNEYRRRLREILSELEADVALLNYTITSNHVHLLAETEPDGTQGISRLMQLLQGQHAQAYNQRRDRHGAFWEDRFHATMIETGAHLWHCLAYLDLNMVRAGAVKHPREWEWTGYHELMGHRQRYRLIDLERVCGAVGVSNLEEFRAHYGQLVEERLRQGGHVREPRWTESLAVGSRAFVDRVSLELTHRQRLEVRACGEGEDSWLLREGDSPYV